jgi:hypothetical protein
MRAPNGPRGFALTLPGESPIFSAEDSALAIVFMEPGRLRLDPEEARTQIAAVRASDAFAPFVQLLLDNSSTPLDFLAGESGFVAALDAVIDSLSNPFSANPPQVSLEKGAIRLSNPSPRFLRVSRLNSQGVSTLPDFLPAYGSLLDRDTGKTVPTAYRFEGLGPSDSLPDDTSLVESTYWPTVYFLFYLPLLELALGQPIPVEAGLRLSELIAAPALDPRQDLAGQAQLSAALQADLSQTIGEVAARLNSFVALLNELFPGGDFTGRYLVTVIVGASLLYLASLLNEAGITVGLGEPA